MMNPVVWLYNKHMNKECSSSLTDAVFACVMAAGIVVLMLKYFDVL